MFLPQCERPRFTPIKNNRQNYSSVCPSLYNKSNVIIIVIIIAIVIITTIVIIIIIILFILTGVMFLGTVPNPDLKIKYTFSYKLLTETDAICFSNLALDFTILHCYITAD